MLALPSSSLASPFTPLDPLCAVHDDGCCTLSRRKYGKALGSLQYHHDFWTRWCGSAGWPHPPASSHCSCKFDSVPWLAAVSVKVKFRRFILLEGTFVFFQNVIFERYVALSVAIYTCSGDASFKREMSRSRCYFAPGSASPKV